MTPRMLLLLKQNPCLTGWEIPVWEDEELICIFNTLVYIKETCYFLIAYYVRVKIREVSATTLATFPLNTPHTVVNI